MAEPVVRAPEARQTVRAWLCCDVAKQREVRGGLRCKGEVLEAERRLEVKRDGGERVQVDVGEQQRPLATSRQVESGHALLGGC